MSASEGWTDFGGQARKFHFIPAESDRALCGKWEISPFLGRRGRELVGLQPDDGPSPHDCVGCRRRFDARDRA